MEIITIETQPNEIRNVSLIKARLANFDFMGPSRGLNMWVEMLNPSGIIFDSMYVPVTGDDWQDWPVNLTEEEDHDYISHIILRYVGLSEAIQEEADQSTLPENGESEPEVIEEENILP